MAAKGTHVWRLTPARVRKGVDAAREGATSEGIAEAMGCKKSKLYDLFGKYPEFAETIQEAKDHADGKVQTAGFRAACGYTYQETTQEAVPVLAPDGKKLGTQLRVTKIVEKHVAPQPNIWRLWMMNRRPAEWRDRSDLNVGGEVYLLNAPTIEKPDGAYE